jgi:hypothetical protein
MVENQESRKEVENGGDEQDCLAKQIKTKKQDATDEERSPQRRGRWWKMQLLLSRPVKRIEETCNG